jgi:hypothetical protein
MYFRITVVLCFKQNASFCPPGTQRLAMCVVQMESPSSIKLPVACSRRHAKDAANHVAQWPKQQVS